MGAIITAPRWLLVVLLFIIVIAVIVILVVENRIYTKAKRDRKNQHNSIERKQ